MDLLTHIPCCQVYRLKTVVLSLASFHDQCAYIYCLVHNGALVVGRRLVRLCPVVLWFTLFLVFCGHFDNMLRFLDYSVIHARILTASIKSIILSDESRRIHAFARSFHLDIIYLQKRTRNKRCMNNIMVCIRVAIPLKCSKIMRENERLAGRAAHYKKE